jgi:hypothetical protein
MAMRDFFRRVLVPVRQRPTSSDLNAMQVRLESGLRALSAMSLGSHIYSAPGVLAWQAALPPNGFYGAGFFVAAAGGMNLIVAPGVGSAVLGPASASNIDSDSGADWTQDSLLGAPLVLSSGQTLVAPAPPIAGHSRIDIIEVRPDYLATDPQTVGIFNTATEVFDPTVRNKSLDWDLLGRTGTVNAPNPSTAPISYVVGQDFAGGIAGATEPTTTSGYIKIGRINMDGAIGSVTQNLIADMRPLVTAGGVMHCAGRVAIPGTVAGLGSEDFETVELPPGYVCKIAYPNATPPSAGESYLALIYIIGGDPTPRTANVIAGANNRGILSLTDVAGARIVTEAQRAQIKQLNAADIAILDGSDPLYTVLNGTHSFAIGQPAILAVAQVRHPAGSALSATEVFNFHYMLSQG